jgi:hypothetical protein
LNPIHHLELSTGGDGDGSSRWHRDLLARRHAAVSRPRRRGRPRTLRSIRALVLRLARENGSWGYRRVHGELLTLGVKVAPSTVWEILHEAGIDPAPDRAVTTWTGFLRSHAQALLAADFIETVTLTGARMYILVVIQHASRRIRVLGATAHPTAAWVGQAARNLVMDLDEEGCCKAKHLIRDRDGKYPAMFDAILADAGIEVVLSGIQVPRMNAIMGALGADLPPRTAGPHADLEPAASAACTAGVRTVLQLHRPHQGIANVRPLKPLPEPITDPDQLARLNIHRHDRLGGVLHEYQHAA